MPYIKDPVELTAEEARRLFRYDPATGDIFRLLRDGPVGRLPDPNTPLKTTSSTGYRTVGWRHKTLQAHRLAWLLHYGAWPEGEIDHIDRDRTNNRIENLRSGTRADNMKNKSRYKNTSVYPGVRRRGDGWRVCIGKENIGHFKCLGRALRHRVSAERERGYSDA